MSNHAYRYAVGETHATLQILAHVRLGPTQRADRYWVRMTCCGTHCQLSHSQIRERQRRPEAKSCRHCFAGPAHWPSVAMAVPDRPTWAPHEALGPVVLLEQVCVKSWRIRWVHCGREEVLTRHRITDLLGKARRGLNPLCRVCAREAASRRAKDLPLSPPPAPVYVPLVAPPAPVAPPKTTYYPDWLVGPAQSWPRPPSLAGQPATLWGAPW
ncbi:MAG: hypothetical protein EOM92_22435 [Gammaproteobacteria bacterium]|jgi:hypothetical protein|nr:hypothetical protein [Gammaproteobacteria bacterium]